MRVGYFTRDSANELMPHCFLKSEYRCQQRMSSGYRQGPFFDLDALSDGGQTLENANEMMGPDAEIHGGIQHILAQFTDNFIITRNPLFVV